MLRASAGKMSGGCCSFKDLCSTWQKLGAKQPSRDASTGHEGRAQELSKLRPRLERYARAVQKYQKEARTFYRCCT